MRKGCHADAIVQKFGPQRGPCFDSNEGDYVSLKNYLDTQCFVVLMYFFSSVSCDNDRLVRIGLKKKSLDLKTLHVSEDSMCKDCHDDALVQKFGL